ncbi:MAG: hypothetical protein JNK76_09060 [Planctomycetales bacterium]|nr:hypothetical protein [Planctomycetales bacterium]MBN8627427.1 hypothetical protein [Planctomycetota bacterium]
MPLFRDATPYADLSRTKYPWMVAAYCSSALALCVILGIAAWGASVDFEEARVSNLRSEINRLRSHGVRTVIRLQELMNVENAADGKLSNVQFNAKLTDFLYDQWNRHIPDDPSRLYAGIIDSNGRIVAHYRRELVGKKIGDDWESARVPEAGDDVVETSAPLMTGTGERALDISIPIMHGTQEVGAYHSGFRLAWFENELALKRRETTLRWGAAFAVITIVGLTAGVSLFKVARRLASLQGVVAMEHVRRLADLGTLAGGIAHEVRNPMNAIRLNLHVIKKLITSQGIRDDQTTQVMDETISEMERVDGLLRTMLEYARPAVGTLQIVDCAAEIRSVATFLSPLLERERIALKMTFGPEPCMIRADRGQFRQVVLNLVKNAMEAMKSDASIDVDCRRNGDLVEVTLADEGPGISPEEREQIFEPFFSTKEIGTGLGLTLCRRYVEGAGGTIHYEVREPHGARFVIRLPAVSPASEHEPAEPAEKLKSVTV